MIELNLSEVSQLDDYAAFEAAMQPGAAPVVNSDEGSGEETKETPAVDLAGKSDKAESDSESGTEKDTSKDAGDDDDEELDDEKPVKGKGLKRRFSALTEKIRGLEAKLAQQSKSEPGPSPDLAKPAKVEDASDAEPVAGKYDTYEEYVRDYTKWTLRQEKLAADQKTQKQQFAEKQKAVTDAYGARETELQKSVKDYNEVIASVEDIIFPGEVGAALLESEVGPDVAYALAKDRKEAERIAKLTPLAAVKAIGAIEARILAAKSTANPSEPSNLKVSKAPEPIEPSRKPATRAVRFDDPNVDFSTFEKAANARFNR